DQTALEWMIPREMFTARRSDLLRAVKSLYRPVLERMGPIEGDASSRTAFIARCNAIYESKPFATDFQIFKEEAIRLNDSGDLEGGNEQTRLAAEALMRARDLNPRDWRVERMFGTAVASDQ
ncbi:MAG: hypothetical protein VYC34_11605, partial [Planctomycetota bacterium]|nr:hypothetical protein [Planctomycetota bacterium]